MSRFFKFLSVRLGSKLYAQLRQQVLRHDGWRCQSCGTRSSLEVHHQDLRSRGSDDSEQNLITLCVAAIPCRIARADCVPAQIHNLKLTVNFICVLQFQPRSSRLRLILALEAGLANHVWTTPNWPRGQAGLTGSDHEQDRGRHCCSPFINDKNSSVRVPRAVIGEYIGRPVGRGND
jgi:hypothetical protein